MKTRALAPLPILILLAPTALAAPAPTSVTFEGTAMSSVDALPGHQAHQAVIVLPARLDGKLWVGTLSWTASKPVEVRLLYDYIPIQTDAAHGKPITTQLNLDKPGQVAISLIRPVNQGLNSTAASFNAGSLNFAAKAVAFHTITGIKFTVTYAVDAVAKNMTR
jgi:hypothetical protein